MELPLPGSQIFRLQQGQFLGFHEPKNFLRFPAQSKSVQLEYFLFVLDTFLTLACDSKTSNYPCKYPVDCHKNKLHLF